MTHLERKLNDKQLDACAQAFKKFLKNNGEDQEDLKSFREQFREWQRRTEQ